MDPSYTGCDDPNGDGDYSDAIARIFPLQGCKNNCKGGENNQIKKYYHKDLFSVQFAVVGGGAALVAAGALAATNFAAAGTVVGGGAAVAAAGGGTMVAQSQCLGKS